MKNFKGEIMESFDYNYKFFPKILNLKKNENNIINERLILFVFLPNMKKYLKILKLKNIMKWKILFVIK